MCVKAFERILHSNALVQGSGSVEIVLPQLLLLVNSCLPGKQPVFCQYLRNASVFTEDPSACQ